MNKAVLYTINDYLVPSGPFGAFTAAVLFIITLGETITCTFQTSKGFITIGKARNQGLVIPLITVNRAVDTVMWLEGPGIVLSMCPHSCHGGISAVERGPF